MSQTVTEARHTARLRAATQGDVPALAALYRRAWNDPGETEEEVGAWLEAGGILLVEKSRETGGEPICALRWREAPYGWEVGRLATLEAYRGQGLGRWLLTKLEALAIQHNVPELRLTLGAEQAHLLPYYGRMGYRACGEEPLTLRKRVGGVWQRRA